MTDIIEAAINTAMEWTPSPYDIDTKDREAYGVLVDEILKVVTPLIRAAALEEAAKVAEYEMTAPIIEAAARALMNICEADLVETLGGPNDVPLTWEEADERLRDHYRQRAPANLAAFTPLIRAQVLEEAAKVAEEFESEIDGPLASADGTYIAAALRALKQEPLP